MAASAMACLISRQQRSSAAAKHHGVTFLLPDGPHDGVAAGSFRGAGMQLFI